MDYVMLNKFNECEKHIEILKSQNGIAKENVRNCLKGALLNEYLKSCDMADLYIKKIEQELLELQEYLELLE